MLVAMLPGAAPTADLTVVVESLRSQRGVLRVCVTAYPDNFPDCEDDRAAIWRTARAGAPVLQIDDIPPGNYALSVIHDENGNNKLDTFAGIPREGFGFSNNPAIRFGPPRFQSASFAVAAPVARQTIRIKYML